MADQKKRKDQVYGSNGELVEEIEWDGDTLEVTYRRWDTDGLLIEERPARDDDRIGPPPGFWGDDQT